MNVLIMDDNKEFSQKLKNDLLVFLGNITDKTTFTILNENFENKLEDPFDFAFLDIDLLKNNGIEIAKDLKENGTVHKIIFVSAHSHLVFDSLVANPYFFLRKSHYTKDLNVLFELLEKSFQEKEYITLKANGQKHMVDINDIIYIQTSDRKLKICTINNCYSDDRLLKDFLNDYRTFNFVQIHKSTVINLAYVLHFSSNTIELAGRIELPIGRLYRSGFLDQYQQYVLK